MSRQNIKNILFDLGGVIMDIEKQRCVDAFKKIGLTDADKFFGDYGQGGPFGQLEEGTITAAQWREQVRSLIGKSVSDNDIDNAFMAFLIGIPVYRLENLRLLRKKYRIYLLSNTNPVMWNAYIADQFCREGLTRNDYFDGMVTSFEARALKPSADIFDYTAKTLSIKPEETIFIDDSKSNCDAAAALGWGTIHVPEGSEFIQLLHLNNLI